MTSTLIPAYPWEGDDETFDKIYAMPPGIAVMNPDSGPGTAHDPMVTRRCDELTARGWELVGYVHTDWLRRPLLDMTAEVTRYRYWYPAIAGVMWDEFPGPATGVLEAALMLEGLSTRLGGQCVFNPGVPVDDRWFDVLERSIIVTFEGYRADYHPIGVAHEREAHITHSSDDRWIGAPWGYATSDTMPNPYDAITGPPWTG